MKKMRILHSRLSGKFYAIENYEEENGIVINQGKKHDVTFDVKAFIAQAIEAKKD